MTFTKLPPVRRPVPTGSIGRAESGSALRELSDWASPYGLRLYRSGTEALGMAICAAKLQRALNRPEVILPAYGCPDLISACVWAGCFPVLVDTDPSRWGYNLSALEATLTPNTLAIVAVNLLGVGDQAAQLLGVAKGRGVALIQDSAQYLPDTASASWIGDYVVLSFGRGKPLNLLGGGALLQKRREPLALLKQRSNPRPSRSFDLRMQLMGRVFNFATHSHVYWLTSQVPGFHVGSTRYVPLGSCVEAPLGKYLQFAGALSSFRAAENYSIASWEKVLSKLRANGIRPLECTDGDKLDSQYLRLPLLAPTSAIRDRIVSELQRHGLGASAMYQVPLNRIAGVPPEVATQGPFTGAEVLSSQLFTLPTHSAVTSRTTTKTLQVVTGLMKNVIVP